MQRTWLVSGAFVCTLVANAQLSPRTDAPLIDHLLEVNKEWRTMDPAPGGGTHIVHFADENERIACHLHRVVATLRSRTPQGLPADAIARRRSLLDRLDAYADRGRFPINDRLPYRNPVFIDTYGTACAVGQLMIESGERPLAERIASEMELAYVHDMHRDDVATWAATHGFTEDELAWIQPGYPPSITWSALGGGTDGTSVEHLVTLGNGDLVAIGHFTHAGGVTAPGIARFDGTNWSTYPALPNGNINCGIEFNGALYVGGSFNGGTSDLARWNGTSWTLSTVFASKYAEVTALHAANGALYAAGAASGFAGVSYSVKQLVGGSWNEVGDQLNGPINTITLFNGALTCGGAFTGHFASNDSAFVHVAALSGNAWQQLADGLDGTVNDLLVGSDGSLYAGGDVLDNILYRFGVARITAGAPQWEQMMPNAYGYIFAYSNSSARVNALQEVNGAVYFGGSFTLSSGLTMGSMVGRITGTPDEFDVLAAMDDDVYDLAVQNGTDLVAGGAFNTALGQELPHLAYTQIALGVPEAGGLTTVALWPNPTTDHITFDLGTSPTSAGTVDVIDASGRVVKRSRSTQRTTTLDVGDLAAGSYTLRLSGPGAVRTASFMKR